MDCSTILSIFAQCDINGMGVTFDDTEKKFVFDFDHDGAEDVGLSIRMAVDSAHKKSIIRAQLIFLVFLSVRVKSHRD